jgi:hypothetical protein
MGAFRRTSTGGRRVRGLAGALARWWGYRWKVEAEKRIGGDIGPILDPPSRDERNP